MTSQSSEAAPVTCDRCGEVNSSSARYCSTCGARLGAADAPREERKLRRRKYEALARTSLGDVLARLGRRDAALVELETAVRIADQLIGPPGRFTARAALARAAYALGDDDRTATANAEARELVDGFVATLAPERADLVRTSPLVRELFANS